MWRLQDILIEITDFIFDQKRSGLLVVNTYNTE